MYKRQLLLLLQQEFPTMSDRSIAAQPGAYTSKRCPSIGSSVIGRSFQSSVNNCTHHTFDFYGTSHAIQSSYYHFPNGPWGGPNLTPWAPWGTR